MKITICGSMAFAKEMKAAEQQLMELGHSVLLPGDTDDCIEDQNLKVKWENDLEAEVTHCLDRNLLKDHFDKIQQSDVVLHLNYPKNGIEGYIGASGLMELGVAFALNKKIFLLNPIDRTQKYALEVELIKPTVLNGDLSKINNFRT